MGLISVDRIPIAKNVHDQALICSGTLALLFYALQQTPPLTDRRQTIWMGDERPSAATLSRTHITASASASGSRIRTHTASCGACCTGHVHRSRSLARSHTTTLSSPPTSPVVSVAECVYMKSLTCAATIVAHTKQALPTLGTQVEQ
jgi:hypothetical protein